MVQNCKFGAHSAASSAVQLLLLGKEILFNCLHFKVILHILSDFVVGFLSPLSPPTF